MLRCLFSTLFVLLVCSTFGALSSYAGGPGTSSQVKQSVEIFKKDNCVIKLVPSSGSAAAENNKIKKVDNVFFVTIDKVLVAVAEANYQENGQNDKYDFVAAYVERKSNWDEEIFTKLSDDNCGGWKTQLVTKKIKKRFVTAKNVVYGAAKKNIYLLAVNKASADNQLEYNIVTGNVSEDSAGTSIAWDNTKRLKIFSFKGKLESTNKLIESSSTDGGSFFTKDEKIVFMLRATNKERKYFIAFLELKKSESDQELEILHTEETAENCYLYLFSWSEKIVMVTANCTDKANQIVKEFSDIKDWKESPGPFYYLSEFLKDKTSFTTADIKGTDVLLFAQQNKENDCTKKTGGKTCFTFWFSDGNRTYNIEKSVVFKDDVVSSSFVYAKDKLFFCVNI